MTSRADIQYAIRGYNAKAGILDGRSSCLGFTVAAQSWDQSGCHVTWIITSTTGMDLTAKRGDSRHQEHTFRFKT